MNKLTLFKQPSGSVFLRYALYIVAAIMFVAMSLLSDDFLTARNIMNIIRQNAFVGMIAIGMTFVIITGGIDLSVGSLIAFGSMCAAFFCTTDSPDRILPVPVVILIGLAASMLIGLVNGLLITKGRVAPFIATLGTMTITRGLELLINDGRQIIHLTDEYCAMGQGFVGRLPIPIIVYVAIILIGFLVLHFTKFGRHVYAVGGNINAAKASGIKADRVIIAVYVMVAAFAGISGMVLSARLGSASPISGNGYDMDAIAAVVIGGTSLSGGVGTIVGTIIGTFILGIITNGLDLLNVSAYYQQVIKGLIIIAAVLLDSRSKK